MRTYVIEILYDVDMHNRHAGLAELVWKRKKIRVSDLKQGQFVICVNSRWTQFVMIAPGGWIAHHRDPEDRRLNPRAILKMPELFMRGVQVSYKAGLDEAVRDAYREHYPRLYEQLTPAEAGETAH